jgi:hypothetical protein
LPGIVAGSALAQVLASAIKIGTVLSVAPF